MFETRLHRIGENHAIDRRKLWEGWLQWANKLSRIDSDNIARNQFGRDRFTIDAFIELFSAGADVSEDDGVVSNENGTMVAASKKIVNLDISGEYWINWSLTLESGSGDCRFVGGVPFIGNTFIGSATDFKAEMGWYNNSDISEGLSRGPEWSGPGETPYEMIFDNWDSYGKYGVTRKTKFISVTKTEIAPQKNRLTSQKIQVHLSGSGSAQIGRNTGNVGVLLFCQPSSEFKITASRLTIQRRNR